MTPLKEIHVISREDPTDHKLDPFCVCSPDAGTLNDEFSTSWIHHSPSAIRLPYRYEWGNASIERYGTLPGGRKVIGISVDGKLRLEICLSPKGRKVIVKKDGKEVTL